MTNQELKEKLLEEFDERHPERLKTPLSWREERLYIRDWFSTKLDALLLSEDEVTTSIYLNTMYSMSLSRTKAKAIIKNQRDKLITKG